MNEKIMIIDATDDKEFNRKLTNLKKELDVLYIDKGE